MRSEWFKRQTVLPEVGERGQNLLASSSVLIVGAGGLGHPAALYLAAAGIGRLDIIDGDNVEMSNLHRQILFRVEDCGQNKANILTQFIQRNFPFTQSKPYHEHMTLLNAQDLIAEYDLVLDCTDNFQTKFLIHDVCFALKKKLVQASIYQFEGMLQAFDFSSGLLSGPCLRCLHSVMPQDGCVGTCGESGVLGATAGQLGTAQAMEALKLLLNINPLKNGQAKSFNLLTWEIEQLHWKKRSECALCSQSIDQLNWRQFHLSAVREMALDDIIQNHSEVLFVDIRNDDERTNFPFVTSHFPIQSNLITLQEFENNSQDSEKNIIVIVCQRGIRSKRWIQNLSKKEKKYFEKFFSLRGGVESLTSTMLQRL